MRAWKIVLLLIGIGIVGAWVGYWVGDAAGWSTGAEFPWRIGGGDLAIGLSILFSFGSVMLGVWWFIARPLRHIRRLAATGSAAHATIRRAWRTGLYMAPASGTPQREIGFEVEVHPDGGQDYATTALGLLTEAQEAELKPGAEADVRYEPSHPSFVVVVGPVLAAAT